MFSLVSAGNSFHIGYIKVCKQTKAILDLKIEVYKTIRRAVLLLFSEDNIHWEVHKNDNI